MYHHRSHAVKVVAFASPRRREQQVGLPIRQRWSQHSVAPPPLPSLPKHVVTQKDLVLAVLVARLQSLHNTVAKRLQLLQWCDASKT